MKHPEIKVKIIVITKHGKYFLYFHSFDKAEAFALNELTRVVSWTIRDVDTNELLDWYN